MNQLEGDGEKNWVKPQNDVIKVTVDATLFAEQCVYGFGLVVRDNTSALVCAKSRSKKGNVSSDYAEVMAIKEALSWIKENQWNKAQLESDNMVMVQVI